MLLDRKNDRVQFFGRLPIQRDVLKDQFFRYAASDETRKLNGLPLAQIVEHLRAVFLPGHLDVLEKLGAYLVADISRPIRSPRLGSIICHLITASARAADSEGSL